MKQTNFFAEAEALAQTVKRHGFSQTYVAKKLGFTQSALSNKLRLLKLAPELQQTILEFCLTERHARALLRLPDEEMQWKALMKIVEKNMNVRAAEEYIDSLLGEKEEEAPKPMPSPAPTVKRKKSDYRIFLNTIDKALEMVREAGVKPKTKKIEFEGYYEYTIRIDK